MHWKAIYGNGTELNQFNEDDSENKYGSIDRDRIIQFHLIDNEKTKVIIHLEKNKKLIYRRRVAKTLSGKMEVVYLAGWQEHKNNVNTQMICFVFEDGHVEIVDKFKEDHRWFYSIVFMPEEKTEVVN